MEKGSPLKTKRKKPTSTSTSNSDSKSKSSSISTTPIKKQKLTSPIFQKVRWGVEHEFNGLRVCNYGEFVDKVKPIFKAFCPDETCKLKVTTELHKNNEYDMDGTTDICYYLEAQIGVMEGFNYSLFEKCCDEFNKFIKCVSRIDHTDTLYVQVEEEEEEKKNIKQCNTKKTYSLDNILHII